MWSRVENANATVSKRQLTRKKKTKQLNVFNSFRKNRRTLENNPPQRGEIVSLVLHIIPSWLCPLDLLLSRRSDEGVYLQECLAPAFLPSSDISINL